MNEGAATVRKGSDRRVLLAPTFDPELSAAYLVGEDAVSALRGSDESIRLVLTGHPHLRQQAPNLIAAWRHQAETLPNVEFFDSGARNVMELLADIDVMVSDVSSVATQFLVMGRPLVRLIDLSKAEKSHAHVPDETESELQSVSTTVNRRQDLPAAVRGALAGPESPEIRANRELLMEKHFGGLTDGRAGERIAANLAQILACQPPGE
jgi:CDP-glycerol glycerophosphotransferase (TagB/SpsB family)